MILSSEGNNIFQVGDDHDGKGHGDADDDHGDADRHHDDWDDDNTGGGGVWWFVSS